MPSTVRIAEGPSFEDTPPSTRPSSSASSSSSGLPPLRTTSMDSLPTSGGPNEKVEHIPTRTVGAAPKPNTKAMMFVKTGPAQLYKSATEQMKKAQTIKAMRKQAVQEEDEPDWQQNLDKWKSKRRIKNTDVLDRVIEAKKFENEASNTRRKSKTFNEMREETGKRGVSRFNLIVHDDDNDDLSSLLSPTSETAPDIKNETNKLMNSSNNGTTKDILEHDNKDTKSDAGFCTGSDTGSDGVFPEDNISDTSSALGDKKEPHDSLEAGLPSKDEEVPSSSTRSSTVKSSTNKNDEYTYAKAIQGYKDYAENAKKMTSSTTSLNSISSGSAKYERDTLCNGSSSPSKSKNIGDKLDFFAKEMDKEFTKPSPKPVVTMREKSPKIDITKRRTMFEMSQSTSTVNLTNIDNKLEKRRSSDMTASTGNLRNRVTSFENIETDSGKVRGITPTRDTKFKEKLASFSVKKKEAAVQNITKRGPEKDKNFHQKLANFTHIEKGNESYSERRSISKTPPFNSSLKFKIASFEQLDQQDPNENFVMPESKVTTREKSVSMECLTRTTTSQRKFETKFSKGSVSRLDEESTTSPNKPPKWQKPDPVETKSSTQRHFLSSSKDTSDDKTLPTTFTSKDKDLVRPAIDIPSMDLSTPSADPPISTSSPRSKPLNTLASSSEIFGQNETLSSTSSKLEPEVHYDDVVSTEDITNSSRSSMDSGKIKYTDDDINEVIDNLEEEEKTRVNYSTFSNSLTYKQTMNEVSFSGPFTNRPQTSSSEPVVIEEWSQKGAPLAPPTEPPPPPPVDDGSSSEGEQEIKNVSNFVSPTSPTPSDCPSFAHSEASESSARSAKDEIRKRRSDFLGTSHYSDGLNSPQSDLDAMIQAQERETENKMLEARKSLQLSNAKALSEIEQSRSKMQPPPLLTSSANSDMGRDRYTWEDRLRDDTSNTVSNLNDTDDGYGYHTKLAELEMEMMRHDRSVLSRTVTNSSVPATDAPPKGFRDTPALNGAIYDDVATPQVHQEPTPTYSKMNGGNGFYDEPRQLGVVPPEKPQRTYNTCYDSSGPSMPEPLPRKKNVPTSQTEEDSRHETVETGAHQHNLSKESRYALSATPRTRLSDGESWIKRKPQANKDYSKHWLIQEAEQRRLEQRPPKDKSSTLAYNQTTSSSSGVSSYINRALEPSVPKPVTCESPNKRASDHHRVPAEPPVNRNSDPNAWRNQAITYQPISNGNNNSFPAEKPIPDAIISSLTQRVHNKSRPSSANNSSGRPSPYNTSMSGSNNNLHYAANVPSHGCTANDEDYHDYMNADAINMQQQQQQQHYQNYNFTSSSQMNQQTYSTSNHIYSNQSRIPSQPSSSNVIPTEHVYNSNNKKHHSPTRHTNNQIPNHPSQQSPQHSQGSSSPGTAPLPPSPSGKIEDQHSTTNNNNNLVSVSGKKKCSHCGEELGRGAAMIIESLRLFYHIPCFVCCVCGVQLGNGEAGADVRVRNHALHCQNCYSNDKGMKFSEV